MDARPRPTGFGHVLWTLLGAARRRAAGRRERQRQIYQRAGKSGFGLGLAGFISILVALATHGAAVVVVEQAVEAGQRIAIEQQGRIVVSTTFKKAVDWGLRTATSQAALDEALEGYIYDEAAARAEHDGSRTRAQQHVLLAALHARGAAAFVTRDAAAPGLAGLTATGLPALLGALALFVWSTILVLQGEGLELDVQRRRHPMWEWLLSHPVPPAAVFLAEMLAPIAANPIYWTAPVFPGALYAFVYGEAGLFAAPLVGLPIAIAAACLGKALETVVMLRAAPRSRGALIGMMSWLGFTSGMLIFLAALAVAKTVAVVAPVLAPAAGLPWPWLGLFLGLKSDGTFSMPLGIATCLAVAGAITAGSVAFSVWGANAGLVGRAGTRDTAPARRAERPRFATNPLYRKELTWFARDRSALVQAILVPLSLAAVQLFNLRGLLEMAQRDWTYLCGVAIILGTYFLATLGPRSLASEGGTLWIALTWPVSLESLLKAKERLWALLSSGLVGVVLAYTIWVYPASWPGIALVGLGWLIFARSMAEKAVTLATVKSESGEVQKVPAGRYWATQLGTLSFAVGVISKQWPLAAVGIVYSWLTAAAMWQNFRARLPFLLDPWSERLPPAPTLMHAMIAISGLVDLGGLFTGMAIAAFGRAGAPFAFPLAYGAAAAIVAIAVGQFLLMRQVDAPAIWQWPRADGTLAPRLPSLLAGAGLGLALGVVGCGYVIVLHHLPWLAHLVQLPGTTPSDEPRLQAAIFIAAVAIAPPAEEYLFRGLLYRALDREWGGWRAVAGSAIFFASYHPPASWLPVGLVGALNALVFKRTGRLWPAVALHAAYNAAVLGWQFWG